MAKRTTYHVTKTDEGWQGKKPGADRASVTGPTKKQVVEKTIEIAKKQPESSVVIHRKDNIIQEERTYPRSSDPNPPKG
jgi:hypothetical protein